MKKRKKPSRQAKQRGAKQKNASRASTPSAEPSSANLGSAKSVSAPEPFTGEPAPENGKGSPEIGKGEGATGSASKNELAESRAPRAAGGSQASAPGTDPRPPRPSDAPARALAANLSAYCSKSHSGLHLETRRTSKAAATASRSEHAAPPGPPRHDFRRPALLSEQQVRALDSLHRRYAEQASGTLAAMVRGRAQVALAEVRQCSYFDFIRSLHNPTSLQLVYCAPGKHPFVAEMTPAILFPILDRLLGGDGEDSTFPIRPFTRIEAPLVNCVFQRLLDDLAASWSTCEADGACHDTVRFDVRESEHNPMLMQVFRPSEPTVVLEFELTLGSSSGPLHICLPTKPFESILGSIVESSTLCPRSLTGDAERRGAIQRRLEESDLTLAVELDPVPIALEDLLRLRPGDVIATEVSRSSELSLRLEGQDVFRGQAVAQQGRRAMRVTGFRGENPVVGAEAATPQVEE